MSPIAWVLLLSFFLWILRKRNDSDSKGKTYEALDYIKGFEQKIITGGNFSIENEGSEIHKFLSDYKINSAKLRANEEVMNHRDSEPDVSKDITPTIEWMASPSHQPLGYPEWFMTAFPDVVFWASELGGEKFMSIMGNPAEDDVIGTDEKMNILFLRKIVNAYLGEGKILEVV